VPPLVVLALAGLVRFAASSLTGAGIVVGARRSWNVIAFRVASLVKRSDRVTPARSR
jgi:hypothetical protein